MNMVVRIASAMLVVVPGVARAQAPSVPPAGITVLGIVSVETPPDRGTLAYTVRGEGVTADAATGALVARQRAITGALAGLAPDKVQVRTGEITLATARSADCKDDDDTPVRLSTGPCAVRGYLATMAATATLPPAEVGTAAGLVARLGAERAHSNGFWLAAPAEARRRAVNAAIAAARAEADAAAAASGRTLGPVIAIRDEDAGGAESDVVVTGNRLPAPEMMQPAPIRVDLAPEPVTTNARLVVIFALR